MRWPAGFMWGTGASSTQCEGAAPASDWWDWERSGHAPASGAGNGFGSRYAEDFRLFAGLGLTHHRLSMEWARLEPAPGVHDEAAVEHYRSVLVACREAGIVPWVCLHHFTLPRWFADSGGFLVEGNRTGAWARHVDWVAEMFGNLVGGWQPVNETNIYAALAYGGGGWPPGHRDRNEMAMASEAIHLATAEAAVRLKQTGAPVASVYSLSTAEPMDDHPETLSLVDRFYERSWTPWLGLVRDGILEVRNREPVERADLRGCFDLIGFSYYATTGVRAGKMAVFPDGAPISPLGYGIWADGLGRVLDRLQAELPGAAMLVAEYGIGTDDDAQRAEYLQRGLEVTNDAIGRGIDVQGFFHWTGVDNYEWLHGFDVSFGLIDRDRNVRPSAVILTNEAQQ